MYIYRAVKEQYFHPEIGSYSSYAIEVYKQNSDVCLVRIPDVFASFRDARRFICLCNECQPEPVHMEEICMDYIQ